MDQNAQNNLEETLRRIEGRLDDLSNRIARLEQGKSEAELPVASGPPPFILPEPTRVSDRAVGKSWLEVVPERPFAEAPPIPGSAPVQPVQDSRQVDEMEYQIGLTGLLRGGTIIFLLGLLFLVAMAISKGWITPSIQFAGEIALCVSLIAVGQWKREEREDFGQILTGIGSCGLYFSFAGGHSFKHFYEGDTLVFLFLIWSLVNLVYSSWQSSKSFLIIGLIGGLIGSVMPSDRGQTSLIGVLHFLVLVPTAFVIIRNRWNGLAIVMWVLSGMALTPVFFSSEAWILRLVAMYGSGLLSCFAYAKTHQASSKDASASLISFMASVTAIGGMLLDHESAFGGQGGTNPAHGSHQVLLLSALLCLMGYRIGSHVSRTLYYTALGIAAILAPIGLDRTPEAFTFLAVSSALAFGTVRYKSVPANWLSWIVFGLGIVAYLSPWSSQSFLTEWESPFLVFALVVAGINSWSNVKLGHDNQAATLVASGIGIPLVLRLSDLWIAPAWGGSDSRALFVGFSMITCYLIVLTRKTGWMSAIGLGYASLVCALAAARAGFVYPHGTETLIWAICLAMGVGLVLQAKRFQLPELQAQIGSIALLATVLLTRLVVVWLAGDDGLLVPTAIAFGLVICGHACAVVSQRTGWTGTTVVAWLASLSAAATSMYLDEPSLPGTRAGEGPQMQCLLLVATLSAILLTARATKQFDRRSSSTEVSTALILFVVWSRLGQLALTSFAGMKNLPAISATWIVFASLIMAIGFRYRSQSLRFVSFGVFALTIGKVLLFDLSNLDAAIRAAILLFLGGAMILGGYVYIRNRSQSGDQ
ncbi:MAG: DUF2339 domain-containing protein [Fimbriimonadaceae bacterium]